MGLMGDPRWLAGHSDETTDELIALEGTYRTDSIVVAFAQAIQRKAARLGDAQLSTAERVILGVEAVEDRVNSGGFDSLFRYESALVPDIVPSLEAIARTDVADLARSAIEAVGIEGPITASAIELAMDEENDARDDRLDALDRLYFDTAGDLADPLLAFIKSNRDQIKLIRPTGLRSLFDRARRAVRRRLDRFK
jgi:hypothetical protein